MPVNTPSREYIAMQDRWKRCRDTYNGSDAVKAASTEYLPLLGSHLGSGDRKYQAYKARAVFYNAMARTVDALAGGIFQKAPEIKAPSIVLEQLDDVTLKDESVDLFAQSAGREVLTTGRRGILVDVADAPRDSKPRPIWLGYAAEDIYSYRVSNAGGDETLTRVVLREAIDEPDPDDAFAVKEVEQFRVLELTELGYTQTVWREKKNDVAGRSMGRGEWTVESVSRPSRRGTPLDYIPFTMLGPASISPRIAKPPLLDLVDVNISHYQTMADLEHGRHFVALPTPVIIGAKAPATGQMNIGSEAIWYLDAGAEAKMLEFTGQGLGALEKADTQKRHMMAVLGSRMMEEQPQTSQAETAFAVNMRHAGEQATLRTLAQALETGLTLALQWHAWWVGSAATPGETGALFTLNKDFASARMSPEELRAQVEAFSNGAISFDTLFYNLTRGDLIRPGVSLAEEEAAIEDAKPPAPPPPVIMAPPPIGEPPTEEPTEDA